MANKIWEIVETGGLRKLEELSNQEDIKAISLLSGIWGVGQTTARQWVAQGIKTLDDVKDRAKLTRPQQIGLKHYHDLLERMPREEAKKIDEFVKAKCLEIDSDLVVLCCGSYRRGKETCGDVDFLITHPDGKSHQELLPKVVKKLGSFLTDHLVSLQQKGRQSKYLGVCRLDEQGAKHRRIDIITVPRDEYACAIMYFTGSAHFNRSMRHLAGKMGMSLSEHSLNKGVVRKVLYYF